MKRFELLTGEREDYDPSQTLNVQPRLKPPMIIEADRFSLSAEGVTIIPAMVSFWVGDSLKSAYGVQGCWYVKETVQLGNEVESFLKGLV